MIKLNGDVERPICHFELPPSEFKEKKMELESKFEVIDIESLGIKVKNTKRFYVVNPTN